MAAMVTLSTNAFATPINLDNTPADASKTDTLDKTNGTDHFADETTNVWQNGEISEEVRVTVDRASRFEITIPKEIVLNGNNGSAIYKVKCEGDLAGDQSVIVVPDPQFILNEDGGKSTNVAVTQNDTEFTYVELNDAKEYDGSLSASEISAGKWCGSFYFNIKFKADNRTFNDYSWAEIAAISETGNAASMFNIGDEKEITIGEYSYYNKDDKITITHPETTYHVQILGFNHDNKSDGTGKAGITVGLKEIMITKHVMNYTINRTDATNSGGWKDSDMRTYINNNVYNALPSDVKSVIKTVNKVSDIGNNDTSTLVTTNDNLFLFSASEVINDSYATVENQGNKYQFYTDDNSRIKYLNNDSLFWWLRSATTKNDYMFSTICSDGTCNRVVSNMKSGVVFGFCI